MTSCTVNFCIWSFFWILWHVSSLNYSVNFNCQISILIGTGKFIKRVWLKGELWWLYICHVSSVGFKVVYIAWLKKLNLLVNSLGIKLYDKEGFLHLQSIFGVVIHSTASDESVLEVFLFHRSDIQMTVLGLEHKIYKSRNVHFIWPS